jgi:HEPN domain-containing protein
MKFLAQEWFKAAGDDLIVLEEIVDNPLITNITAFHYQQCIEKCFKAALEENGLRVPKIHSLLTLYGMVKEIVDLGFDEDILDKLDKLYIDTRYPSELGLLPYGKPTMEDAREFFKLAMDVHDKVKGFLERR